MVFVKSITSNQEWIRLRDAAAKQFPNEVLAGGEIMRCYAMSGIAALKLKKSERTGSRAAAHEHQATMTTANRKATSREQDLSFGCSQRWHNSRLCSIKTAGRYDPDVFPSGGRCWSRHR